MASRRLDPAERIEIERHTTITLDMLERIGGVTTAMMFVGYQCHERCDGSGYPNRRKKMLLHTYGRIGAIADAYTALTHERPHRSAYTPYEAVYQLLVDGAADKFDRQILRVMLDRLSLVPIGSYVTLSTGELAKVVRPNPAGMHTKPVVALIGADGRELDETIDLGHTPEITLDRAYGNEPPSHRIIQAP